MTTVLDVVSEAPKPPEVPAAKKELPPVEKKFSEERARNNGYAQEIKASLDRLEKDSPGVDLSPEKQELDQLKIELSQTDSQAEQQLGIAQREVEDPAGTKQQDLDIKYGPGPGIQPHELSDLQGRRIGQSVGQVEWRARPDGTAIEDAFAPDLPPVRDGYTRLYRGNLPDTERSQYAISGKAKGRYFTENLSMAAAYGGDLRYVDVPTSELPRIQSYETRNGPIRLGEYAGNEYVIPDTLVPRDKPSVERLSPEVIRKQKIVDLFRDPSFVSLYRYENPTIPYDDIREGVVSKTGLIGSWYTDSLSDLQTYTVTRIKGQRGGRFVVIRVKREDLDKYDATKLPETRDMDIESGNYVIPPEIADTSRVEVDGIFKDSWEGKRNLPTTEWNEIGNYINANLSDEAIVARLTQ